MNKIGLEIALILFIFSAQYAEILFEVKDAANNKVLDVSTDGLRVLNGTDTLMVISADGIRAYVQRDSLKGLSRSFSVSTTTSKDGASKSQNKVFEVATDAGSTFYNPLNNSDKIFSINKTSIIANVDNGLNRDFVINGTAAGKSGDNLMKISDKDIFEAINDSTMLFYKKKNAFRVGYVKIDNDSEVGQASFATGYQSKASGPCASAFGIKTESTGYGSTSMGTLTKAYALSSTAMGSNTTASGYNSTSTGWLTTAQSLNEFVTGSLNTDWGSPSLWNETDPLFIVGNGILTKGDKAIYRNAVTVLKNGNTSIGNIVPNSKLDVAGDVRINDNSLYLRGPNDTSHGLKFVSTWNSTNINGPALFGYDGGVLGTTVNNTLALRWDSSGSIYIPALYTTTGNTQKKYLFVDQYGKLCINTSKESETGPEEMIAEQQKEIESLKNENIMIKKELEEIRRILNNN
jgi:hypothetical protein